MFKMFTRLGLAQKLTLSTVFLMACSLVFITATVYFSVMSFGRNFLEQELQERTRFIENSLSEPLWNYDRNQLEEVGNSLLYDAKYIYISGLRIQNPSGEVLFEKGMNHEKIDFESISERPYTETSAIKINREGQLIGLVSVAITNQGFVKTISTQLLTILTVSLALLFLVSMSLRYYFNKLLTWPLNKILSQVHQIEKDNYEVSQVDDLPLELDVISKGLNRALSLVKQRNNDILCYADDLEQLVRDRTAELEGQITKNLHAARLVAVGEMAADVAHEINNPLTIIDLHVSKIKKMTQLETPLSNRDVLTSIDKIQSMVSRMVKIIKGLKSVARDGNADPMLDFSVSAMLDEVIMLVDMKIKGQEINFKLNLDNPTLQVIGREVQISQVLVNLINNSVDAISNLPDKWITLNVKSDAQYVKFIVTDSGQGISKDLQEKIMRPFFTTKDATKGTGLGLSISKNIIEEHEGRFLYNGLHENTQFIFTLKRTQNIKMSA